MPVDAYPALTDVGAWRGHGMAIPPLLGSGPAPFGGSYTAAPRSPAGSPRAAAAGVVIVPEVDLPGHCFAALAAVPELRDPADRSGAVSVQSFVDNVLNPGVAATRPFLEAVAGELADLFPSPWLHVGGDEVADGAWSRSPAAQAYAAARGVERVASHRGGVHGRDHRARLGDDGPAASACGRRPPSRARCDPASGYVVGWKSAADCRRLAAAGHTVVASPAEVYYLDMAADDDWDIARHELGRSLVGRRHRGLRPARRLVARRAGAPRRHPGLRLDRARPRPPDPRTPALPPPRRHRRHGLADPVLTPAPRCAPSGDAPCRRVRSTESRPSVQSYGRRHVGLTRDPRACNPMLHRRSTVARPDRGVSSPSPRSRLSVSTLAFTIAPFYRGLPGRRRLAASGAGPAVPRHGTPSSASRSRHRGRRPTLVVFDGDVGRVVIGHVGIGRRSADRGGRPTVAGVLDRPGRVGDRLHVHERRRRSPGSAASSTTPIGTAAAPGCSCGRAVAARRPRWSPCRCRSCSAGLVAARAARARRVPSRSGSALWLAVAMGERHFAPARRAFGVAGDGDDRPSG